MIFPGCGQSFKFLSELWQFFTRRMHVKTSATYPEKSKKETEGNQLTRLTWENANKMEL